MADARTQRLLQVVARKAGEMTRVRYREARAQDGARVRDSLDNSSVLVLNLDVDAHGGIVRRTACNAAWPMRFTVGMDRVADGGRS